MPDLATYDPIFEEAGREWNVDPRLLKAMAAQESSGNPRAISSAGAQGLMQIIPSTQRQLGVTDPNDPVQSIWGAAKYMATALDAEKTPQAALLYYHGGPDWRARFGRESAAYVPSVAKHYQQFAGPGVPSAAATEGKVESDDAFLKRTAVAPASKPHGESDADFLARTASGKEAPAAVAPLPEAKPGEVQPGSAIDQVRKFMGSDNPPAPTTPLAAAITSPEAATADVPGGGSQGQAVGPTPITAGLGRIGQAAAQGWAGGGFLTPAAQAQADAANNSTLIGHYLVAPMVAASNLPLRALGAVGGAIGQGFYEAGNALGGPDLGRDLYMGQQVAPFASMGAGVRRTPNALEPPGGRPQFVGERFAPPAIEGGSTLDRINQLIMHDNAEATGPGPQTQGNLLDSSALTRPMVGEGATQSVGAAASREGSAPGTFGLSPKEVAAYRSTAEGQKLLEPQQPGIPDRNAYVPGVEPSAAEIEQSVNTSRELKSLKLQAPAISEEARAIASQNNDARRLHFEQLAGSDVSLMNAKAARGAQAEADLKATWAGKTDADPAAVLDKAAEIKASPDGRRPLVRSAIDSVTSELTGPDGKPLTDPEQLYGVRKQIDDLTSREAAAADPKNVRAAAALDQLKTELDTVIEAAAPGFKQYLQNFSTASRPIDAMEALQKFEPKLYDAQNRMQYSRVQSMMRQIVDARSAPGINPYKSIPDETMQQLWALRDDLRRSAGAEELARTTGSDTAQNAWDIAKTYGKLGSTAAAHGVANY